MTYLEVRTDKTLFDFSCFSLGFCLAGILFLSMKMKSKYSLFDFKYFYCLFNENEKQELILFDLILYIVVFMS